MRDGVKRCREVQEDEDAEAAKVSSNEEIVGDLDEGSLRAVLLSEAGLEGLIELMVGDVQMELAGDHSFQSFAYEGKVGDRPVVLEVVGVQAGFFEYGGD